MKWSSFFVFLVISQLLISCSDATNKKEADAVSSAEAGNVSPTALTTEAKEKRADVVVQGLKGKVEVLSETVYQATPRKRMIAKSVFKYDDNGNRIELTNYKPDGKIGSTVKSTYDESGKLIREQNILADGTVDMTSEIRTDAKGNRIEQKNTRAGSTSPLFNFTHYFKYDEKGQLVERTALRANGSVFFKYNFSYDNNGNKTEWVQAGSDSTVVGKVIYKYDDKNNLIEEVTYGKGSNPTAVYTYTYEFDKNGNWRRQTKLENGKAIEIRERNISYH